MEPYWTLIEEIINESDIILNILDARFVEDARNRKIEEIIKNKGKPFIYVLNKADLISRRALEASSEKLRHETNAEIVYVSNKQRRTIKNLLAKIRKVFAKYGKRQGFVPAIKKPYREAKGDIVVGVVGYPNVGKSSIINSICFKKKMKVSPVAGTTHGIHWITANNEIKLIDTPGVIPLGPAEETKLGLIAARGPEKLKDSELVAGKIIEIFMKDNKLGKLEKFYNFNIDSEHKENPYMILEQLSIAKHHLKKGGLADETRTSVMIVKDWQTGKLRL